MARKKFGGANGCNIQCPVSHKALRNGEWVHGNITGIPGVPSKLGPSEKGLGLSQVQGLGSVLFRLWLWSRLGVGKVKVMARIMFIVKIEDWGYGYGWVRVKVRARIMFKVKSMSIGLIMGMIRLRLVSICNIYLECIRLWLGLGLDWGYVKVRFLRNLSHYGGSGFDVPDFDKEPGIFPEPIKGFVTRCELTHQRPGRKDFGEYLGFALD